MFQCCAVGLGKYRCVGVLERNIRCRLAERKHERRNNLKHEIIRTVNKRMIMQLMESDIVRRD